MTELDFVVAGAEPDRYAATPTLNFQLRVSASQQVHALALRCQIRIEPQRRRYDPAEEERLLALFGETPRWGDSLKPFLWTHASTVVAGFSGEHMVELPVPCTYDFDVTGAKYLHSLDTGEIPLILLFNGTVFGTKDGGLSVDPVPWHKEARYQLPVAVWRQMMDLYYPGAGWLRLRRDTLDALEQFKTIRGLPTWEQAIDVLLKEAGE